jgi:hypothetical protein
MAGPQPRVYAQTMPPPLVLHGRPQPLGFLPTRQFWLEPEHRRLAAPPFAIFLPIVGLAIVLLSPVWWLAVVVTAAGLLFMLGLLERYIREAAKGYAPPSCRRRHCSKTRSCSSS